MENLQKTIRPKVVTNEKDYLRHVSKPTFISTNTFVKIMLLFMKLNQL